MLSTPLSFALSLSKGAQEVFSNTVAVREALNKYRLSFLVIPVEAESSVCNGLVRMPA
jgi:hypothetical protein